MAANGFTRFLRGFGHVVASIALSFAVGLLVTMVTALAGLYDVLDGGGFPFGGIAACLFFPGYWIWRIFAKWPQNRLEAEVPPKAENMSSRWYTRAWVTIVSLVLFFPIGIFLLWRYQPWALWVKLAATGGSLFFAAYVVFGSPLFWF